MARALAAMAVPTWLRSLCPHRELVPRSPPSASGRPGGAPTAARVRAGRRSIGHLRPEAAGGHSPFKDSVQAHHAALIQGLPRSGRLVE
jgi:hypothetical protein